MADDRTHTDRQRATVNAILESRARVGDAANAMQEAMTNAARTLIRAASLDTEYHSAVVDIEPEPEPIVQFVGACGARVLDGICTVNGMGDCYTCVHNTTKPEPEPMQPCGAVKVADCACKDCVSGQVCRYVDGEYTHKFDKAKAKAKAKAKRERVRPTAIAQASSDTQTHASTFESVQAIAPAQEREPLPTLATPAPLPYTGEDATGHVYTRILRAMASDAVGPSVNARVNWQASVVRGGILRVSIDLAHIESVPAYVGQSDKVWGQALATTIRPNQSKTAKRRRVTYAPLTDALDWAFYLVTPTNKARGDAFPMPVSQHLRKGATVHDLRKQVDASSNWRLSVKDSILRVDIALPTYANVVPVKRTPTWGNCIATTRHPGTRRIAKTITLGPCLVLLLDVIQRIKGRAG